MARTLDELLAERPGDAAAQSAHMSSMVSAVRAFRLRELRQHAHLTQEQVAASLDISQKRVSEIERGEVDRTKVDTLRRYVAALGGTLRIEVRVGDDAFEIV